MEDLLFPEGFLWGVATSAHQVEGENYSNQWFEWENSGGIKSGDRCGRACDWWNDWNTDFDLARDLGVNALRLSVEWSRIEPRPGEWDESALARYRSMLEGLHRRGIRPMVTLHHFTHPLWFEREGAFLNAGAPAHFEQFTRRVLSALGELCSEWVTFNEPNVHAAMGYTLGQFPPGQTGDISSAIRSLASMALAHARAYRAIHELQPEAQVGWAHNFVVFKPANPMSPLDQSIVWLQRRLFNESFVRIMKDGEIWLPLSLAVPDLHEVRGTCDFVGLNVYGRFHVAFDLGERQQFYGRMFVPSDLPQGDPGTEMAYGEAYPPVISAAIRSVKSLNKPIYILENGVPDASDRIRPWLLVNSLKELYNAIRSGADVHGYFHWTLTDNFEWSEGWNLRFGVFELDRDTQQRTIRPSGRMYSRIVQSNALPAEFLARYAKPPAATSCLPGH